MPSFRNLVALLATRVYQRQVVLEFPLPVLERRARLLKPLPEGYEVSQPTSDADYAVWADLLNEEPGFSSWTAERIRSELVSRLIDPRAATLIRHNGRAVACGCVVDASTRRRRIAHGMYLFVAPSYRARTAIAYYITFWTMRICVELNYDKVIAMTDSTRLSALMLYLSNDCVPVKNSLYAHIQWYRIEKRLRPTLRALARRKSRTAATSH